MQEFFRKSSQDNRLNLFLFHSDGILSHLPEEDALKLTRKNILITTAITAAAVKLVFAAAFYFSYFESYHLVPGLDMQTLLRFSEWLGENRFPPFFTFHRLTIFLVWLCNGQNHCVWAIFIIQSLVGIAGCLAMADITLKLSGNRISALACGIAGALYLPFLVYEFSILQETFMVNFALFAFWALLNALHKRFAPVSSIIFAVAIFAALAGRPAAIFWCGTMILLAGIKMFRKDKCKKMILPMAILGILLIGATIFNRINCGITSPFYNVLPYTMQYNAEAAASSGNKQIEPSLLNSGINAATRLPQLFQCGEIPENQNIYFWCEKIPLLNLLIAPGLLIPLAAAGIMILLLSGEFKRRYGLLLLPLATLALPLCAREAIGRYRLMLIPYFFMITACAAVIFYRMKSPRKRGIALFGAGVGAFFSIHNGDVPDRIRPSDHSAWAMAIEYTPGSEPEVIIDAYRSYWEKGRSERSFRMTMDKALHYKRIDAGLAVCSEAEKMPDKINPDLIAYYRAWCFAMLDSPEEVEACLRKIRNVNSLPPDAYEKAFMLRDRTTEILRQLRKIPQQQRIKR